jgi:transcriptional regulator with XRE-family HTH domain
MQFGKTIKKQRKDRGLSIKEAADLMKISQSHLHYIELGKIEKPKMETLYKLICFYGLPVDDTCQAAKRVPMDVYYKIANNRHLWNHIRTIEV